MKRILLTLFLAALLVISFSPSARADSFLSISVTTGATTTVSCNNSTAAGVALCTPLGFFTSLGSNKIVYLGPDINGVSFASVTLNGNQPGSELAGANTSDSKASMANTNAVSALVTVSFASNNFSLPSGSVLSLSATQGVDNIAGPAITEQFTGWGDSTNSLTPGAGVIVATPDCTAPASPPTKSCHTDSQVVNFGRAGNFGLNGIETLTLVAGQQASAQASIIASAVPEPTSVLLFGSGMLILVARKWHKGRKQGK